MNKNPANIVRHSALKRVKAVFSVALILFVCGSVLLSWGLNTGQAAPGAAALASPSPSASATPTGPSEPVCGPDTINSPACRPYSETEPKASFVTPANSPVSGSGASIQVEVMRVPNNLPPVAESLHFETGLNTPVSMVLSATDPDSAALTYSIRHHPKNGSIIRSGANVTYVPNPGFEGQDGFIYAASDGSRWGPATVHIRVGSNPNQPPVIQPLTRHVRFRESVALPAVVTDPENDPLAVEVLGTDTRGAVWGTAASITYDPQNKFGRDYFYLRAQEVSGTGQVAVSVVPIRIDNPDAMTAIFDGNPNQGGFQMGSPKPGYGILSFPLINTHHFPDGPRTLFAQTVDQSGRIVQTSNVVHIDNTPPLIAWAQKPSDQFIRKTITIGVTATDNHLMGYVLYEIQGTGRLGSITQPTTGNQYLLSLYDIMGLSDGLHRFKFIAVDAAGNGSQPLVAEYIVDNSKPHVQVYIHDAPVIPQQATLTVRGVVPIRVEATDEGSLLHSVSLSIGSEGRPRTTTLSSPVLYNWDTSPELPGLIPVKVRARDNVGNVIDVVFNNIAVTAPSPPVAHNQTVILNENQIAPVALSGTGFSGGPLSYSIATQPNRGTLSGTPPNLQYQPLPGFNGTDGFSFKVSDGLLESVGQIGLVINGVNNPPVVNDISVTVHNGRTATILPSGTDPEFSPLIYAVVTPPARGSVAVSNNRFVYTPGGVGEDSFTYKANDGELDSNIATVFMTVVSGTPTNNPPVALGQSVTVGFNTPRDIQLEGYDPDGQRIAFQVTQQPAHGTVSKKSPSVVTYFPNTGTKGSDSFQFVTNDGAVNSTPAMVSLTIADKTPPIVTITSPADGASVSNAVTIQVSASDNDAIAAVEYFANDVLKFSQSAASSYGYVLNTQAEQLAGPTSLRVRARDVSGNTAEHAIAVQVANTGVTSSLRISNPVTGQYVRGLLKIQVEATGVENPQLTINGIPAPLSLESPGRYIYAWLTNGTNGPHTLVVTDGPGGSLESQVDVIVDNIDPEMTWIRPSGSNSVSGIQSFTTEAFDTYGLNYVKYSMFINRVEHEFYPILHNSNDDRKLYSIPLNTNEQPFMGDGTYQIFATVFDKAGNRTTVPLNFTVNNTNPAPSDAVVDAYPEHGAYISSDFPLEISAGFPNTSIVDSVGPSFDQESLVVWVRDGASLHKEFTRLTAKEILWKEGRLRFSLWDDDLRRYENAEFMWRLNVKDGATGQIINPEFKFTRMMSKARGGEVVYKIGDEHAQFKISVPPNALTQDMFVVIEAEDNAPMSLIQNDSLSLASEIEGQRRIAGPFKTFGRTRGKPEILPLVNPAMLEYKENSPPQQAEEQARAVQIFRIDGTEIRPLGTSQAKMSAMNGNGGRTISGPITAFSTFVINSVPVPANGLEGLYSAPNPFSPHRDDTKIRYSLSGPSDVVIAIFDLFGNLVKKFDIPSGSFGGQANFNEVPWNGRNGEGKAVANGGYIISIVAKDAQGRETRARYKVGVVK